MDDLTGALLIGYLFTTIPKLFLIWLALKMLDRFAHSSVVVLFGLLVCLYHAQAIYRGTLLCDAPHGWVDYPNLNFVVNWIILARDCSAPIGEPIDHVFFYITGPISIAVTVFLTGFVVMSSRCKRVPTK